MQTFTFFCNVKKCLVWFSFFVVCPIHFFSISHGLFSSLTLIQFFFLSLCVNGRFETQKEFNVTLDQHSHHCDFYGWFYFLWKFIACKNEICSVLDFNEFDCKVVSDVLINCPDISKISSIQMISDAWGIINNNDLVSCKICVFTWIEVRFWQWPKHISNGLKFENRMIEHKLFSLAVEKKIMLFNTFLWSIPPKDLNE